METGGEGGGAVRWRKKVSIVGGAIENWLPAFGELNARNKQLQSVPPVLTVFCWLEGVK